MISITAYMMLLVAFILNLICTIRAWKYNIKLSEENGRLIQMIHELNKDIRELNKKNMRNE